MTTKLTLTIDDEIIRTAKRYASLNGRSLSDIVENYLKTLRSEQSKDNIQLSPIVQGLLGSVTLPKDFNYKDALADELSKKHLK